MPVPLIMIFVRHSAGCKYKGNETARKCDCRKWLRWTQHGKQNRIAAQTRSWTEAEVIKRNLEDQLSGRSTPQSETGQDLREAINVFLQDKRVQGVTDGVRGKYARELERLRVFAERKRVYAVKGLTRELLTGYCGTFEIAYPSTQTRSCVRSRTRSFLRYCYEAQWLERIPMLPKMTVCEAPTLPLTAEEYQRLLSAADALPKPKNGRGRALFQLMRWSGLAIRDALTLRRDALTESSGQWRVVTTRTKTGTHVSVPLPPQAATDILRAAEGSADPRFLFWDGSEDIVKHWTKYVVAHCFQAADIAKGGNMMSHRLRDTFAVDLLERGVPMEEVSRLLGHTSIKTTEKSYAKWSKGRQDRTDALVIGTWGQSAAEHRLGLE